MIQRKLEGVENYKYLMKCVNCEFCSTLIIQISNCQNGKRFSISILLGCGGVRVESVTPLRFTEFNRQIDFENNNLLRSDQGE